MTTKALTPIERSTIKELVLLHPKKQFIASGGTEQQFIREAGFALQIMKNNTYLQKMDKDSIIHSIVNVALTGLTLNPELRQGYLIPRKGKLYFQSSYMGKKDILLRAGIVKDVWVKLVYSNDIFEIHEGTNKSIKHIPDSFGDRGELVGGYWCAELLNGQKPFGVMTIKEIEGIKKRSEAVKAGKGSPWDTNYNEMAKKTILNRAYKSLPKSGISEDIQKAMAADSELDYKINQDIEAQQREEKEDFFDDDRQVTEDAEVVETKEVKAGKGSPWDTDHHEMADKEKLGTDTEPEKETVPKAVTNELIKELKKSTLDESEKKEITDMIPGMTQGDIIIYIENLQARAKEERENQR